MPRKKSSDDETPRRRRGAAAAVAEPERGLLLRILLYSPKDTVAGLIAFTACSAIITNALFLQRGPHPAPMFGSVVSPPAALLVPNPMPRPRPVEADAVALEPKGTELKGAEPRPAEPKSSEPRLFDPRPAEPRPVDQKPADPLANLVKATTSVVPTPANVLRPPAPIPGPITGPHRVAAVQRALTEYGYGQLKPTGTIGPDTRSVIERFERERRLPVTGQVSERLVRELAIVIGHPIE